MDIFQVNVDVNLVNIVIISVNDSYHSHPLPPPPTTGHIIHCCELLSSHSIVIICQLIIYHHVIKHHADPTMSFIVDSQHVMMYGVAFNQTLHQMVTSILATLGPYLKDGLDYPSQHMISKLSFVYALFISTQFCRSNSNELTYNSCTVLS